MTEQFVAQPTDTVRYWSARSDLRLVMKPRYATRDPASGQVMGVIPGVTVSFRDGQLSLPPTGTTTLIEAGGGNANPADMEAEDVHAWLQRHPLFGDLADGFGLIAKAAPPVSDREIGLLMDAAASPDAATLNAIIEQEQAGWQREGIVGPARKALERIEQAKAAKGK